MKSVEENIIEDHHTAQEPYPDLRIQKQHRKEGMSSKTLREIIIREILDQMKI